MIAEATDRIVDDLLVDDVKVTGPAPARTPMRRRISAALRGVLATAGVVFIVLTLHHSLAGKWRPVLPSWPRVVIAFVLLLAGLLAGGTAWRTLFGPAGRARGVSRGFYFATLARYVPGGIWQPIGQVGSAAGSGIPMTTALIAYPVHAVIYVVSGAILSAGVAFTGHQLPMIVRILAGLAVLTAVFLNRKWMAWALTLARRVTHRLPTVDELPSQSLIFRAFAWSFAAVMLTGVAFAVLVNGGVGALCAFSAGWTIGYVLIPIPSGLGIREAVLIGLMPVPTSVVLTSAIAHRIALMIAELVVAGAVAADSIVRRRPSGRSA
jgi:hypothetical protein